MVALGRERASRENRFCGTVRDVTRRLRVFGQACILNSAAGVLTNQQTARHKKFLSASLTCSSTRVRNFVRAS